MRNLASRCLLIVAFALTFASAAVSHAETPAELTARGEDLARAGNFSEAIAVFKQADAVEPRARHACLIALAYTRRELWPQAEIFLALCRQRANASDPLPDWVPRAQKQLDAKLATAEVAPVTIVATPAVANATVTVSSFAPDEVFSPREIHLAYGTHVISVEAPGYKPRQLSVHVIDRLPQRVVFDLERIVPPPPLPTPSKIPWVVMSAGALVLGGAIGLDIGWLQPARDKLAEAGDRAHPNPELYDQYSSKFDSRRRITLATYGAGAAILTTGVVLYFLDRRRVGHEREVHVTALPTAGGAFVGVTWQR
jgi:hypothetical protein